MSLIFTLVILFISCEESEKIPEALSRIGDEQVRSILTKAMSEAGGWENWESLSKISYAKKTILYHEDGTVESEVDQRHRYIISPELKGSITWSDSTGAHEIIHSAEGSFRTLDGQMVEGSEDASYASFMSAYFVLFMPFKIPDPGVALSYLGTETLDNGSEVDVILAEYDPSNKENHSTNDTWYYYFDVETGRLLANMVYHAPTYALIENKETTDDHAIRMNLYRESWRVDKDRNKQFLRGVFFYGDYSME